MLRGSLWDADTPRPVSRCLVDGRLDDTSSAFITPRPQEDMLRFRIDVFRFAGDTRNLVRLRACPQSSA